MRARRPVLDPPHVEHSAIEVDLVPAQVADLGRPQPMPEGDQDHARIAMAVAVGFGGLDQGFDLTKRQVLAGAKLGVRSACPQCARAIGFLGSRRPVDACRRFLDGARRRNVRKISVGAINWSAEFVNEITLAREATVRTHELRTVSKSKDEFKLSRRRNLQLISGVLAFMSIDPLTWVLVVFLILMAAFICSSHPPANVDTGPGCNGP